METLRVAFEPFIGDDIRRFIEEGINNHNLAVTGMPEWFPANFVLRSDSDEVLGGLLALIWGGWLRVSTLWVSEVARRQGYGLPASGDRGDLCQGAGVFWRLPRHVQLSGPPLLRASRLRRLRDPARQSEGTRAAFPGEAVHAVRPAERSHLTE
jgi:hypothetical protein